MAKNIGKRFEEKWKNSIPENIFYYRPNDAAQSFDRNLKNSTLRFSAKSPCDCFLFTGNVFYTLELKSVGTSSISFEKTKEEHGVIHKHQIDNLLKFSAYKNVVSGFLFDFRLSGKTYFCMIEEFKYMIDHLNKKSFNEKDLYEWCNPIIIQKKKLRTNYRYDVEEFLRDTIL